MSFDYDAPAELFLSKRFGNKREKYRRFATAAEAIHLAALAQDNRLDVFRLLVKAGPCRASRRPGGGGARSRA